MATMANKDFWQLYKDPRWQRVRLEIMERAGFKCELCGTEEDTLNVHHSYYERGNMPWEYPPWSLHCLCDDCHKKETEKSLEIKKLIGYMGPRETDFLRGILYAYAQIIDAYRNENGKGFDAPVGRGSSSLYGYATFIGGYQGVDKVRVSEEFYQKSHLSEDEFEKLISSLREAK